MTSYRAEKLAPITLLKVDYKIASKAIARRIEPMLPNLIHADQTGFIKGRYIGENIRLINDLMEQTNATKIPNLQNSTLQKVFGDGLKYSITM